MIHRRQSLARASFAAALVLLAGSSCTPDERSLGVGLAAPDSGNAGRSANAAGAEASAGTSGSTEGDGADAGESGAGGATPNTSGGASQSTGGGGQGGGAGGNGGNGGNGGSGGGGGGGSGGAFSGPCGDMDGNAIDDCSETLVENSRFDNNVDHWTPGEWNASNAQTQGPSGSLLVLNDSPVIQDSGFKMVAAEQCVQVTGDFQYEVAARVKIPAGQGGGFGGLNLLIYANDGCSGTFVTGLTPAMTQVTDTWTVVEGHFKMPTAARSMTVRLAATRPFAQPKLQVLFDDVLVKQKLP